MTEDEIPLCNDVTRHNNDTIECMGATETSIFSGITVIIGADVILITLSGKFESIFMIPRVWHGRTGLCGHICH